MLNKKSLLILGLSLVVTACGTTGSHYEPIVDGERNINYQSDLAACKLVAEKRSYTNDDVKTKALEGAAVGAIVGAIDGNSDDIVGGAIVGAIFSSGEQSLKTREERKLIVTECMKLRKHRVVG